MGLQYIVKEGQTEIEAYQEALAEFVRGYDQGCDDGKRQFLNRLGLHQPNTPYTVIASMTVRVPGSALVENGHLYVASEQATREGYAHRPGSGNNTVAVRNLLYLGIAHQHGHRMVKDAGIRIDDVSINPLR